MKKELEDTAQLEASQLLFFSKDYSGDQIQRRMGGSSGIMEEIRIVFSWRNIMQRTTWETQT
jgi:hypothetical protein